MKQTNIALTLMNKNTPVLDLNFCMRRGGYIENILKLHNPEYAPLGLVDTEKQISPDSLNDWWENRCLPDSRLNVEYFLEALNLKKQELIIKSLGLSLSDQYWLKSVHAHIEWKDINFFQNDFSDKIGRLFFHGDISAKSNFNDILSKHSPDYSANGFLDKYWTIQKGNRVLVKGSHGPFAQQACNEVIASNILKLIGCENFVNYKLANDVSTCIDFVTDSTEYVPAYLIRKRLPKNNNESYFQHFMRCCRILGFEREMQQALDYILPFDYLIANEDRNFGNFGVIRNVETLKVEKIAPIFDNGNSFWYNHVDISNNNNRSYPFEFTHNNQIKLIKDRKIFPINKVTDFDNIIINTLSYNKNCDAIRIHKICQAVKQRKILLKNFLAIDMAR